jgi:GTP:adenosylcobinamide-phosphate guanylyltransferase
MDILITAGGIPLIDQHLYEYTKGGYKVMIDILGKPMIQWALDAIGESKNIRRVIVAGLPKDTPLTCKHPMTILENRGELLDNIQSAAEEAIRMDPDIKNALILSGDVPGITAPMIDWMIEKVETTTLDIIYTVVEKQVIEKVFPDSKRTFTKLKDVEVCGGDIVCFRPKIMLDTKARWRKIIEARKSPFRQAALIGFDTLLMLLFKQIILKQAEERVTKRLNISGKVFLVPFAEMGMDVDKSFQLEMMRDYLAKRTTA